MMRHTRPCPETAAPPAPSCCPTCEFQRAVEALAALINKAGSITFFCGSGCAGAREPLLALARRLHAPVAYSMGAKDILEADNPLAVGMIGPLGWGDAARALQDCDLLLLWGTDFPFRNYLPQHGRVAQVDSCAEVLGRRVPICLGLAAEVAEVARALLPLVEGVREEEHLARSRSRHGRALSKMHAGLALPPEARLNAAYVTRLVSDLAEPDAVFCVGLGTPLRWVARYLRARPGQRLLLPSVAGSLIGELLHARRSKEQEPGRQVIAFCDDDMRETLGRELPALHHEGLAVKVLLYAHSKPHADELSGSELLEYAAQAHSAVRRWLSARRASLLAALIPVAER